MRRGRSAFTPFAIPLAGWLDIAWRVWGRLSDGQIGLIAAGIAFYGLLSVFPGITAAVAIAGVVLVPSELQQSAMPVLAMMPDSARTILSDQLIAVTSAEDQSLSLAAILTLTVAVYSASRAIGSFIQGLNFVYEETERRGFFVLKLRIVLLTVTVATGLILALTLVAAIPAALSALGETRATALALVLRWPLLFLVGVVGISFLYRHGPCRRKAKWRWVTPGAIVACLLWVAASYGFSLYVQNFATYNETFGTLGGVIVLLTWMWLSAFVVLLGAQLDAETEAQTARDSTIGPSRPMGRRGAFKADHLGVSRGEAAASETVMPHV